MTHTLDRFIDFVDTPVRIHGEIEQRIQHYLIMHQSLKQSMIRIVLSHPQALAQCRYWLDRHLRNAKRWETHSTSEAVDYVVGRSGDEWIGCKPHYRAAIARQDLTEGKKLRAIPISEERENKTRFLIISLDRPERGQRNKTSILFALKDKPGALHDALVPFKRQEINLTKIESRPSKKKAWEYLFFIDFAGHESEPRVQRALKSLSRSTSLLRILGSYPVAG